MTRYLAGPSAAAIIVSSATGKPVSFTLTLWDAQTGGTQYTDLAADQAGTQPVSTVRSDGHGRWAVYLPDEVIGALVDDGDTTTPRVWVVAIGVPRSGATDAGVAVYVSGDGPTAQALSSAFAQMRFSPNAYGALGDARTVTSGLGIDGSTLTAAAGFTAADVGKSVWVDDNAQSREYEGTVAAVTDATTVTLSSAPGFTPTALAEVTIATDSTAAFAQAAQACAAAGQEFMWLNPGFYACPDMGAEDLSDALIVGDDVTFTGNTWLAAFTTKDWKQHATRPSHSTGSGLISIVLDDGQQDHFRYFFPLTKKYGAPMGTAWPVSLDRGHWFKTAYQHGWEIMAHGTTHEDFTTYTTAAELDGAVGGGPDAAIMSRLSTPRTSAVHSPISTCPSGSSPAAALSPATASMLPHTRGWSPHSRSIPCPTAPGMTRRAT